MHTLKYITLATIAATTLFTTSCKTEGCTDETALNYNAEATKDDGTCEFQVYGDATISVDYVWGMDAVPFSMNTTVVQPKTGDTLNFTTLKFYISNIKLQDMNGDWWIEENSYHLVDASSTEKSTITLSNIPEGHYVAMEYTLGVDSARNVSGAQDGALSIANGMFWSWNSGYIMAKFEGTSPNAADGIFAFHLGGFSGENNVIQVKNADFATHAMIGEGTTPKITLLANPAKLWHASPSVSETPTIHMPGANAKVMADNFFGGVAVISVE